MKATELIGKTVTRTNPCVYSSGQIDRSYMGSKLIILNASDHIISYIQIDGIFKNDSPSFLSSEWCDDNWLDIEDFLSETDKAFIEFKQKNQFSSLKQICDTLDEWMSDCDLYEQYQYNSMLIAKDELGKIKLIGR